LTYPRATETSWFSRTTVTGKEWKIYKFSTNDANEEQIIKETGKPITITQYRLKRYNKRLEFPQLPLIEMTKKGIKYPLELLHFVGRLEFPQLPLTEMTKKGIKYPLELLHIVPSQRYGAKLDETQTANMINSPSLYDGYQVSIIFPREKVIEYCSIRFPCFSTSGLIYETIDMYGPAISVKQAFLAVTTGHSFR
jgi:hypothetical protein